MASDLISRTALNEAIRNDAPRYVPLWVYETIKKQPTVDAAPVVHGEWIKHDYAEECEGFMIPNFECSQCHNWERKESDYCPNCGAKMDGGDEDNG